MRKVLVLSITLFTAGAAFFPLISSSAVATRTCADGSTSHAATAAEAASANNGGIVAGETQLCPEDAKLGINANVGDAKQYLKSLPRTGSAADPSSIDKLNDAMAVCSANFLKQYTAKYGGVTITSAYRSSAYDAAMCVNNAGCGALMNNPNPVGNHQRGLAIDVRASGTQQNLWNFAQQNPQFGVCFPFTSGGFIDSVHMILVGGPGSESSGPGCRGVTKPCDGSNFNPNSITTSPAAQVSQLQRAVQAAQSFFAPPPPQIQCPAGTLLMNGTCVPQQAMTASQASNPYSYLSPTPAPTQTSVTPNVSGTSGATGTIAPTPIGTNTNTNSNANTNGITIGSNVAGGSSGINISGLIDSGSGQGQTGSTTSAIDLINAIANPTTTPAATQQPPTATGTPVALASSLNNTVALHGTNVSVDSSWQASSTYALSPEVSQTFVSQDLSKTPTSMQPMQATNSTFAILQDLKQKLLYVISFLQPFGGIVPHTTTVNNSATAVLE